MSTHSDQLAAALPMSMRVLARNMGLAMDAAQLDINLPQFGMLDFLLTNSEAVQTDLANHLHKDKSVILRQLDQLEQSGWVERQMDANDRRRKNLVVTKAGQEIYRKAAKLRDKVFMQVLEGIPQKDVETMLKVLERMRENAMAKDK
ncbi:MAG: MarR family transcriptional regulator [Flavobacteriales bacterium]|jgi:MarR family transcriptional regulator for hemolysin|nr:MarR family transcriptional regulator [Flavobacteriales bacterium]MBP6573519.1 MarR family transcriptional regulator [Flavobacteriales bacterium]